MTISVILPAFNVEDSLAHCISSLLCQTTRLHEIIIVDDGSSDNTKAIADRLSTDYENVFCYSQPNGGVSAARNLGLEKATGTYVGFVDPDDTVEAEMYEILLETMERTGSDISVLSDFVIRDSPISTVEPSPILPTAHAIEELLNLRYPTSVWAHLYKAEAIGSIRFDTQVHFFEDLLFNFCVLSKNRSVALVPGRLYNYVPRSNGANLSPLNKKDLSVVRVLSEIVRQLENSGAASDHPVSVLHANCLAMLVYKAAISERRSPSFERSIQGFARDGDFRNVRAKGIPIEQRLIVLSASASTSVTISFLKVIIIGWRKLKIVQTNRIR